MRYHRGYGSDVCRRYDTRRAKHMFYSKFVKLGSKMEINELSSWPGNAGTYQDEPQEGIVRSQGMYCI